MIVQTGGCSFWDWHDALPTKFLKDLLNDMRDKIWALARDNADLRDSISQSRTQLDQMLIQGRKVEESLLLKLAEKDAKSCLVPTKMLLLPWPRHARLERTCSGCGGGGQSEINRLGGLVLAPETLDSSESPAWT